MNYDPHMITANELFDPSVEANDLGNIAYVRPDLWDAILTHPKCHPGLADWIKNQQVAAAQQPNAHMPYQVAPQQGQQGFMPGAQGYGSFNPAPQTSRSWAKNPVVWVIVGIVVVALAVAGFFLLRGDDDKPEETTTPQATEEPTPEPTPEPTDEPTTQAAPTTTTNLPLTISESGGLTTYTLGNGKVSITAPSDWVQDDTASEDVPVMLFSQDYIGYIAVSEVGPAGIVPSPDQYVQVLIDTLGLDETAVTHLGVTDIDGYDAESYEIDLGVVIANIYVVVSGGTAYEITTWGSDVYGDVIDAALASIVLM
ncbi:MAG: hypothetical protein WBH82_06825 [Arcanobacterium sp.]